MCTNPQETADLVTFIEEILNGKLHFLCFCAVLFVLKFFFLTKFTIALAMSEIPIIWRFTIGTNVKESRRNRIDEVFIMQRNY